MTLYGWYSEKQRKISLPHKITVGGKTKKGYSSYLYLTSDNKQILVTEVSCTKEYTSGWDDAVYMGIVTKHIKSLP